MLAALSVLTKTEDVKALSTLSEDEKARYELIEKSLLDLQANDPAKLAQQLKLRATRILTLAQYMRRIETTPGQPHI